MTMQLYRNIYANDADDVGVSADLLYSAKKVAQAGFLTGSGRTPGEQPVLPEPPGSSVGVC